MPKTILEYRLTERRKVAMEMSNGASPFGSAFEGVV